MKTVINHEKYGEIVYIESEWTGKKTLKINGVELQKQNKNTFYYKGGTIVLVGSFVKGITMEIENERIQLTKPCKWYEFLFAIVPFVFVMIWGSSVELTAIIPVVGGAIGGGISALIGYLGLSISSKMEKWYFKVLVGLGALVVSFLVCWGVGFAIVSALY